VASACNEHLSLPPPKNRSEHSWLELQSHLKSSNKVVVRSFLNSSAVLHNSAHVASHGFMLTSEGSDDRG